ncbi:MAG: tripartite tricarboxylate transporter substrate binding protein [Betaproteobacteria bacterium]|nr:tripartite tricarboxylate transporter substrate binding protein [Betaproteobacteria bacterium]
MTTNSSHGVNPAIYNQLPYDPEKDFEPVGGIMRIPQLLGVRADFPADDVAGFVKVARERAATKGLSFGTGNTSSRVAAELLKASAKIDMIDVPYRGTPQALQDLVGGQIDMFFADPFAAAGFVNAGTIKALAVTDTTRVPLLPKVPTMTEAGFKDVLLVSWAAAFVPAKTDPAIVERLNKEINNTLAKPQTKEYLHKMGATPLPMSSAELRGFVHSEIARWAKLAEIARIPKK